MTKPNILIVGTGAIGSYYGGRLSQAGALVSTLCRSDYNSVKKYGISITSKNGDFIFKPDEVINHISDYSKSPDYIVVSTKVLPEIDIVNIIKPIVKNDTSIVLIQNGIGIEQDIANAFPKNNIISALAFICVSKIAPATVNHQDYGKLSIGNYQLGSKEKLESLCNLFNSVNSKCVIENDIVKARWRKLIWNAPFNPISVLGGCINTQKILSNDISRKFVTNIMEEIYTLAEKSGYKLEPDIIQKNIDSTLKMTPYKTSMLLDYENNRPLEIEAIIGNPIKIAKKLDIKVPYLESLYSLLILIDSKK